MQMLSYLVWLIRSFYVDARVFRVVARVLFVVIRWLARVLLLGSY